MPLYFFNVRNGHDFKSDPHGTNLTDLGTVRKVAINRARTMLAQSPNEMANAEFEITDKGGIIVEAVKFSDTDL
jgi:hypothetical protein